MLVTLSQDLGKILSSVQLLKIGGEVDFSAAMQVAQVCKTNFPVVALLNQNEIMFPFGFNWLFMILR